MSYTDDNTPYVCSENVGVTLEKLEEIGKVLFDWLSNNLLKASAEKCHLILSTDEPLSINIDNEFIKSSNNKKLLGINLNNRWLLILKPEELSTKNVLKFALPGNSVFHLLSEVKLWRKKNIEV